MSNVDWQVIGTDLVGDALAPSSYQAVATYSGKTRYSVATGYITTAEYVGEISRNEVESVTYCLTYLGSEVTENELASEEGKVAMEAALPKIVPYCLAGLGVVVLAALTVLLVHSRREIRRFQEEEQEDESEHEQEETT